MNCRSETVFSVARYAMHGTRSTPFVVRVGSQQPERSRMRPSVKSTSGKSAERESRAEPRAINPESE
jgi:hypothetical protein